MSRPVICTSPPSPDGPCTNTITQPKVGRPKLYCSLACQKRATRWRKAGKSWDPPPINNVVYLKPSESRDGRASARGGEGYEQFLESGLLEQVMVGRLSAGEAARLHDTDPSNVSRWLAFHKTVLSTQAERGRWTQPAEALAAKEDFGLFQTRYFVTARGPLKGQPPAVTDYHMRWINAILAALPEESGGTGQPGVGGQIGIISPPRHGKSSLLQRFIVWLIIRNPDICIVWAGGNENIAKRFGSAIRDELERNTLLIADYCGPGGSFKPPSRTGAQWRDDEFEVGTRTLIQPAPTFKAVGRGGKVLSMDVDLFVADDIEDHDSTAQPAQRVNTYNWLMTDVASRKEEHTCWAYIGSRQHPQDAASHLIDNPEWNVIVETAHNPDCDLPYHDEDAHQDCVLWPEVRSFRWLMQKHRTVGDSIFQMQYLSAPDDGKIVLFPEALLRGCLDRSRNLGDVATVPNGYELLGSLDPSPGVYQVATLWAWSRSNKTRYLIDVHKGKGGMDGWQDLAQAWLTQYQLRRWVVEDNSSQADYISKREFVKWRTDQGVHVEPFTTGRNKHQFGIGVGSLAPLFSQKLIVLPYDDLETQGKVDLLIREFANFDPDRTSHKHAWRIDQVVSCWFAMQYIDRLTGRTVQSSIQDDTPAFLSHAGESWIDSDAGAGGWLS